MHFKQVCFITMLVQAIVSPRSWAQPYTVTDLGPGTAVSINSAGQVSLNSDGNAYLYSAGARILIGPGIAGGLNASGQVVISQPNGAQPAQIYSNGSLSNITGAPQGVQVYARDINDNGLVMGDYWDGSSPFVRRVFLFQNGTLTSIGSGYGFAINNQDVGAGEYVTLGQDGAAEFTLAGWTVVVSGPARALDINDRGQVVGYLHNSLVDMNSTIGILFDTNQTPSRIYMAVPGSTQSAANGINYRGQAVGWYLDAAGTLQAFIYQEAAITNLNELIPSGSGWTFTNANAINDAGQIVGAGTLNGEAHAFLLTPSSALPGIPFIQQGPASQNALEGDTVTLAASATGAELLRYQWQFQGTNIINATNSSLILPTVPSSAAGGYQVKVANNVGSVMSDLAVLTVLPSGSNLGNYTIADLGRGSAVDINEAGQVVLNSQGSAYLFSAGTATWLAVGEGRSINEAGQVLIDPPVLPGTNQRRGPPETYDAGAIQVLPFSNMAFQSADISVNASAGNSILAVLNVRLGGNFDWPAFEPFLYTNGNWVLLTVTNSIATAVNKFGMVVGSVQPGESSLYDTFAAICGPDGPQAIVSPAHGRTSAALDINDSGTIIGYRGPSGGTLAGFLYAGGALADLGSLGGGEAVPAHVNNRVQVVGWSRDATGAQRAFLYQGGSMQNLNALLPTNSGWNLTVARAINGAGQIVGDGVINGETHAFLLERTRSGAPAIQTQPLSRTVSEGAALTLTVLAAGTAPLRYQWQFQGGNLLNETNATLTITNIQLSQAGSYRVLVSNDAGTATSEPAMIVVLAPSRLDIAAYAGISITGTVGSQYRIEFTENLPSGDWMALASVVLSSNPYLWIDLDSAGKAKRFYRAVFVP